MSTVVFDPVEDAVAAIAAGEMVIVADDENRENEGDLIMAASKATPETINMMVRYGSGIVCVPMVEHQLKRLGLNSMVTTNREAHGTDFTVTVDAAEGISTGISAFDRTTTIRILADPRATADQLVQPGHIFPLRARPGGVLERAGHTEAAVDLATLAGLEPCGVICEMVNEDGTVARMPQLLEFRERFGLKLISIADLIEYRHRREQLVREVQKQPYTSHHGDFTLHVFRSLTDGRHHFALSMGELDAKPTLVRVHSENVLADVFSGVGQRTIDKALERIAEEGRGVVVYMSQASGGLDVKDGTTQPKAMGFRDYGVGAQILAALGLQQIRLLSSTMRRVVALDGYGLEIIETVPLRKDD